MIACRKSPLLLSVAVASLLSGQIALGAKDKGGKEGGGGAAIVCFAKNPEIPAAIRDAANPLGGRILDEQVPRITSIKAVDLHDAEKKRGDGFSPMIIPAKPDFGPENSWEYVRQISSRFRNVIPPVASFLSENYSAIPQYNIIHEPNGVLQLDDVNAVGDIDPVHCVVATVVHQRTVGKERFLYIDQRLFDHPLHSELSKGVLLLHETVYFAARAKGATESSNVRLLVGALITRRNGMTVEGFLEYAKSLGFDFGGIEATQAFDIVADTAKAMYWRARGVLTWGKQPPPQAWKWVADADALKREIFYETRKNRKGIERAIDRGYRPEMECSSLEQCAVVLQILTKSSGHAVIDAWDRGVNGARGGMGLYLEISEEQQARAKGLLESIDKFLEARGQEIAKELSEYDEEARKQLLSEARLPGLIRRNSWRGEYANSSAENMVQSVEKRIRALAERLVADSKRPNHMGVAGGYGSQSALLWISPEEDEIRVNERARSFARHDVFIWAGYDLP